MRACTPTWRTSSIPLFLSGKITCRTHLHQHHHPHHQRSTNSSGVCTAQPCPPSIYCEALLREMCRSHLFRLQAISIPLTKIFSMFIGLFPLVPIPSYTDEGSHVQSRSSFAFLFHNQILIKSIVTSFQKV